MEEQHKIEEKKPNQDNGEVKDEPPDDFLDELLENVGAIATAANMPITPKTDEVEEGEVQDEDGEIDPNFFDELLQRAEVEEEEMQASAPVAPTLKRKRTKSKTKSSNTKNKERSNKNSEVAPAEKRPRLQVRSDLGSFGAIENISTLGVQTESNDRNPIKESLLFMDFENPDIITEPEPETKLTPQEKLSKALENVVYAQRAFQKAKKESEKKFYPKPPVFLYTPTVRKLPSSSSRFTQQIYDNRSPLHTVNNVSFSFNSTSTRLNLHDWGLEAIPKAAMKVAKILGYDADTLHFKRNSIKIPDKLQKSQKTAPETNEVCEQTNSTLFMNAMVQTDDVKIVPTRRRDFFRDVSVQFTPQLWNASTQTIGALGTELPLFKAISELNENQIIAVDDFVQLITEPAGNVGMDIYQKRTRCFEIYKTSQQPSDVISKSNQTARTAHSDDEMPSAPPPPPPMYTFDDDYSRTEIKRERSQDSRERDRYDQHRSRPQPYFGGRLEPVSNSSNSWKSGSSSSSSSTKYYGRGGKRR